MIKVDSETLEYAQKYREAFGYELALRMLPQSITNESLYELIDNSIRDGHDLIAQKYYEVDSEMLI